MTSSRLSHLTSVLGRLATSVAAIALTFAAAEYALRIFYPPPPETASVFSYRVPDRTLGWRLEPNTRIINELPEAKILVETNSQGWRDVEHRFDKPAGTFRILVLGDSFMEGYSVALADSFARVLERTLDRPPAFGGRRVEAINLGVGGYSTLQETLAWRDTGVRYHPDLVVLAFYTNNDVAENSRELQSLLQPAESLKAVDRPFLRPGGPGDWQIDPPEYDLAMQRYEANGGLGGAQGWWKRRAEVIASQEGRAPAWWESTALYALADRAMKTDSSSRRQSQPPAGHHPKADPLGIYARTPDPSYASAWRLTRRILLNLDQDVKREGQRLMVFTVPALIEMPRAGRPPQDDPGPNGFCFASLPGNKRLFEMLEEIGIPYVDLTESFRQAENNGRTLYRGSDGHWNEAGHALAARIVASEIVRQY